MLIRTSGLRRDGQGTALAPAAGQAGPAEVQHVQNQEEDEGNQWPRLASAVMSTTVSMYVIYIIHIPYSCEKNKSVSMNYLNNEER